MTIVMVTIAFTLVFTALSLTGCDDGTNLVKSSLTGDVNLSNIAPKVGESITAYYSPGNGMGEGTWQWYRANGKDDPISGANTDIYITTDDDVGSMIKVTVSFTNQTGSLSAITTHEVTVLTGITAAYNGTSAIYPITQLDTLKGDLTVKAQYSDSSKEDVSPDDYTLSGTLTAGTSTITVTYEDETTTFDVNVSKIPPVVTWPQGLTATHGQTLSAISLDSYTSGLIPGVFSWTTPHDSVGDIGTRSHNMTFTPTNTALYDTVTEDVDVLVSN